MHQRDYEAKLCDFIRHNAIQAEHVSFEKSCHSVEEAAEATGTDPDSIVKNICMITPDHRLVVAIVMGKDRVSTKKVGRIVESGRPRMATPDEILSLTGYPCGGTPSFGFEATFIVDPAVLTMENVYSGGGSEYSLIKIPARELTRANSAIVARIRK
ncbi:MAG: YbaK/EbsC family protein [Firmicutes bacterium]|nr:YbaK/EbsC family protein [Bacillota bacterium]